MGSVIIHQTLYDLFPPHRIDPTLTTPLTPDDFIRLILVPEVGLRLIMEDRGLGSHSGIAEGVKILRASAKYGVAMFPEDGGEWGDRHNGGADRDEEMGAADMILMERAMRRRRELALEEGDEEVEEMLVSKEAQKKKKSDGTKGRKRRHRGVEGSDLDMSDATEEAKPKPLPRPRPVQIFNPPTTSPPTSSYEQSKPGDQDSSNAELGVKIVEACAAQQPLKTQRPIQNQTSRHETTIDPDSSDSLEMTDGSYSAASPSKRRKTKAKGKDKDTTSIGFGRRTAEVVSRPVRVEVDPDITPRGPAKMTAAEPIISQDPANNDTSGPSDLNFYPLKAARARKLNHST